MTGPQPEEAPVVTSPVIGYRSWRVDKRGELMPRFRSVESWLPGANKAHCHKWPDRHVAPVQQCYCGLYAYHDAALTGSDSANRDFLVGAVVGWGAMEVYADGWRAEYARVVALARVMAEPQAKTGTASRIYDVPVVVVEPVMPTRPTTADQLVGRAGMALSVWPIDWSPLVREAKKHGEALHDSLLPEKAVDHELVRAIQQLQAVGAPVARIRLSDRARRGEVRVNRVEQPSFDYASFFSQGQHTEIVPASISVFEVVVHYDDYRAMGLSDVKAIYGIPVEG